MRLKLLAVASLCVFATSAAYSQDATPEKPAVTTPDKVNPDAPVKGENSFTEAQAKERLEKEGYTGITNLALDQDGIWQANAMKGTNKVTVQLDYQGNIVEKSN